MHTTTAAAVAASIKKGTQREGEGENKKAHFLFFLLQCV